MEHSAPSSNDERLSSSSLSDSLNHGYSSDESNIIGNGRDKDDEKINATLSSRQLGTKNAGRSVHCMVRGIDVADIFSENVLAKILRVAERGLKIEGSLTEYPETVPENQVNVCRYEYRAADFWTCGFFPGSIYALLERAVKFPAHLDCPTWYKQNGVYTDLLTCGRHWSKAINEMSSRTDTHDMGFIVQPALQKDWELTGNPQSLNSLKNAAYALASRFSPATGAIRSWDEAINYRYCLKNMDENFLVIIDSMCNLDLLFFVGNYLNDRNLISIATSHADKVMEILLRKDFSTFHLANLDPSSGLIQTQLTNQGWRDDSTWSRGQAWAILGFAQTYLWTKDVRYLNTAMGCADMFLTALRNAKHHHKWAPVWDFDAPQKEPTNPLRDTSAGVIAANGMLLIHQALMSRQLPTASRVSSAVADYLTAALWIVQDILDLSLDRDFASLNIKPTSSEPTKTTQKTLHVSVTTSTFDAILHNATANNNEHAHKRHSDHGLVYADYYLLEFGNKLCRMNLC